jgi:hypothetical protein
MLDTAHGRKAIVCLFTLQAVLRIPLEEVILHVFGIGLLLEPLEGCGASFLGCKLYICSQYTWLSPGPYGVGSDISALKKDPFFVS